MRGARSYRFSIVTLRKRQDAIGDSIVNNEREREEERIVAILRLPPFILLERARPPYGNMCAYMYIYIYTYVQDTEATKCTRCNPETFSMSSRSLSPSSFPLVCLSSYSTDLFSLIVEYSPRFPEPLVPLKRFMQIRNKARAFIRGDEGGAQTRRNYR